jgi:uncharacterized protein (DUF433 family)
MGTDIGTLIVHNPHKHGGRPSLRRSGVSVERIVELTREGWNPERIVAEMEHVSLAEVHAALAYYWLNKGEVDGLMAAR